MIGSLRKEIQGKIASILKAVPEIKGDNEAIERLLRAAKPSASVSTVWERRLWAQETARRLGQIPRGYPLHSTAPMVNGRIVRLHDDIGEDGVSGTGGGVMPSMRDWLAKKTDAAGLLK